MCERLCRKMRLYNATHVIEKRQDFRTLSNRSRRQQIAPFEGRSPYIRRLKPLTRKGRAYYISLYGRNTSSASNRIDRIGGIVVRQSEFVLVRRGRVEQAIG
jgi:hypothetical protein